MNSAKESYCRREKQDEKFLGCEFRSFFERNDSDNLLRQTDFAERMDRYCETMTIRRARRERRKIRIQCILLSRCQESDFNPQTQRHNRTEGGARVHSDLK